MRRSLETSGFRGLAVTMVVGLYQGYLFALGTAPPFWVVNGHVHLGVLSILAIVIGLAVESLEVGGRLRQLVTVLYVVGQWTLPATWWVAFGTDTESLMVTLFLWGACLLVPVLLVGWRAAASTTDGVTESRRTRAP